MLAVVYSGIHHADWRLIQDKKVVSEFKTRGINPFFQDEKYIQNLINKNTDLLYNAEKIKEIRLFCAGATIAERVKMVENVLRDFFKKSTVYVSQDLQAAALASADHKPAILCAIGSSSNATYFDGHQTVDNNYGLGYILGDEGSASWLGKMMLRDWLNDFLPEDFALLVKKVNDISKQQIIDKVYKSQNPELYLCSFLDAFTKNRTHPYVQKLVRQGFGEFLDGYVLPLLQQYGDTPIHFVGTVAAGFQDYLREIATEKGLMVTTVTKKPIYSLVNYYINKPSL